MKSLDPRPLFAIESTAPFASVDGFYQLTGWVCGGATAPEVRARIGNNLVSGRSCLPRPDVFGAHPEALHAAHCGFSVTLCGSKGHHRFSLEVLWGDRWHTFYAADVEFCGSSFRYYIDAPVGAVAAGDDISIQGWCFHSQQAVSQLAIRCDGIESLAVLGLPRDDVQSTHPRCDRARLSGFMATLRLPPGRYQLSLEVKLSDGSCLICSSVHEVLVRQMTQKPGVYPLARLLWPFRFLAFSMVMFRRWWIYHRRVPSPHECLPLIRRAWGRFAPLKHVARTDRLMSNNFALPYEVWLKNNVLTRAQVTGMCETLRAAPRRPRISIVMPVFNPPPLYFAAAIASIQHQVVEDWELCIADDASTDETVWPMLERLSEVDSRIKVARRAENGNISRATNTAAELASGDYLLFVDQDDLLTPDAIAALSVSIIDHQFPDLIYSDDDKVSVDGKRYAPQFKPDWSPELLLSYMYLSHALCVRTRLFLQLGGFRVGFEGSQDYDFALRASEQSQRIVHLPRILYHWRASAGSTARSGNAKPESFEAGKKAVAEALTRRQVGFQEVYRPTWAQQAGLGVFAHRFADCGPSISILIPTKNNHSTLRRCLDSIQKTSYQNYQIVVIDNASDDEATLNYLHSLPHRVLRIPNPGLTFNFAHINNEAVKQVTTDFVLFLNDDTEVIKPSWLSQMMGYAQMQGVGAVGAKLLFANRTIQHAGVVHGLHQGLAGHAFKHNTGLDFGYLSYANVLRNCAAVTGACLLTRRSVFAEVGGFDERVFAVAYNDVDYCYRLLGLGYRSVYAPSAELIHHEGASRGHRDSPLEVLAFKRKYRDFIDPYYSRCLSLEDEHFQIRPWRQDTMHGLSHARLLLCSHNLNFEGAPLFLFELAVALKGSGRYTPIIFSPVDGPLRERYAEYEIMVQVLPDRLAGLHGETSFDATIAQFGQWVQSSGVDLVLANTLQTFYGISAARSVQVPSLWVIHESEPWQTYFSFLPPSVAEKALDGFQYSYANVFVSRETRKQYDAINTHANFCVIPNGLSPEMLAKARNPDGRAQARVQLGLAAESLMVLCVGTVCERKGQLDLVRAIDQLPPSAQANLQVFFVGDRDSEYSRRLHREIKSLDKSRSARIKVVREVPDPVLYYVAADLFVCTSRLESYPRVILEAMAFGLPIVTTPSFGICEQVRPEVNADYYTPGDHEGLARALDRLIADTERRQRYRENSPVVLATLPQFEDMVSSYCQLIDAAIVVGQKDHFGLDHESKNGDGNPLVCMVMERDA